MADKNYIALEATSQEILADVGAVNSTLGDFGGGTDTLVSQITALTSAVATLQDTVNDLASAGSGISSCIRHIQRGTASGTATITLEGFTDVDKMMVLVNGFGHDLWVNSSSTGGRSLSSTYVSNLTSTSLTITSAVYSSAAGSTAQTYSYQVIEFY